MLRNPFKLHAAILLPLLTIAIASAPAFAAPGEANAVIAQCGQPDSDTRSTSEVDGLPQRTLTYSGMRLNFQAASSAATDSWSFTTGWHDHLPLTAGEVGHRMPCFRNALASVQANTSQQLATDPSIAAQENTTAHARQPFGIANLWLILLLVGLLAIFALAIPRARRIVKGPDPSKRLYRRPLLQRFRRRPRPPVTNVSERL
jgi:hypothetical protein